MCIRDEEEEVVTHLNSVQCSCGQRFSIAQKTSKERKNIRSGHRTARCPERVTKEELERNETTLRPLGRLLGWERLRWLLDAKQFLGGS